MKGLPFLSVNRASALSFITAFVILAMQVLVARIVSAKLLNNYAFFVISLTMLGFAVSGVILSRWLAKFVARAGDCLNWCCALSVMSMLLVTALFYHAGLGSQTFVTRGEFVVSFAKLMPFAALYAVPFAFSGFILGLLLTVPELPSRRIYSFDLVGSSCGALTVLPAISAWGVENTLLVLCGIQWAAGLALVPPRSRTSRAMMGGALIAMVATVSFGKTLFEMRHRDNSVLAAAQRPGTGFTLEHTSWDPIARIEVTRIPPPDPKQMPFPALIGGDQGFLKSFKKIITQNNFAFTYAVSYDGDRKSLAGIEQTIYAGAYEATSVANPKVATIGVGGGFDILTALYFNAASVTGVEINSATVKILKRTYHDYFKAWVDDPRVHLVAGEGRHFLASTPQQFDVIQLSGVDSFSGTPGAANVFSENYLYTAEAFDLYLSRLSDNGIINMMRLEHRPAREMVRCLTTAVAALRRVGIAAPARHIIMVSSREENFVSMLVKRTPFTDTEEKRVTEWATTNSFLKLAAAPGWNPSEKNIYQQFLALSNLDYEEAFISVCPYNIVPATDDKPFFFRSSYWWHLWTSNPVIRSGVPALEISLIILGLLITAIALVCVWLPLRMKNKSQATSMVCWRYGTTFALTAVGYMAIEIALLQKFGLFLGHPNYALSVVLAALLFATGIGSLFSGSIVRAVGSVKMVSLILAVCLLVEHFLLLPYLTRWAVLPFALRVAFVSLLVSPPGILMGTFVPTALDRLKSSGNAVSIPWAWGINGIFSVLAPVLSIGLSVTWGIGPLLLSAILIYLGVGLVFPLETSSCCVAVDSANQDQEVTPLNLQPSVLSADNLG